MRKAAEGEFNVSLKETKDNDLNELALSFNTIVSELKGLKEKENLVKDIENKDSLNDLFKFGVNMLKENRFDDSINIFKTLTMLKPDGFGSFFNLGVAYAKKKEYNASLAMFGMALESNPDHEHTINYIEKVKRLQTLHEENSSYS
jgi:tetratricopeptide (TPR) repeat protein